MAGPTKLDPILFHWTFCWSFETAENWSLNLSSILASLKMLLIILITWKLWMLNRIIIWFLQYLKVLLQKLLYIEKWSVDYENVFEGPINICLVERYLNGLVCHEHIIQNPINLEQSVENSFFVRTRFLQIENGDRLPEKCRIEEKSKFGSVLIEFRNWYSSNVLNCSEGKCKCFYMH